MIFHGSHPGSHLGVQLALRVMVLCVILGCSSRSGRDKDVSFFRIPAVIATRGSAEKELTQRRRDGYLAAISREHITDKILKNDRICSKHFVSGKPAYLYDTTSPDWLPTLNLGHDKSSSKRSSTADARYLRAKRRKARAIEIDDAANTLLMLAGHDEQDLELEDGLDQGLESEQEDGQDQGLESEQEEEDIQVCNDVATHTGKPAQSGAGVQTLLKSEDMVYCESLVLRLKSAVMFTEESFMSRDDDFILVFPIFIC